ncbi:MAG: hypothetical protein GQ569_13025 [Methylococcaceae bacterium]|nr:hypothetical protein [Methylococcaceae bacterium]
MKNSNELSDNNTKILEFLSAVNQLLTTQQLEKLKAVTQFLENAKPHVERIEKDVKEKALNFNVFSALGVTRKEIIQSRFLAYLLDPNQQHCQSFIFLNSFLKQIGIPEIDTAQAKYIRVSTEHAAGESLGRMDIVIACQPNWLIVIENKIGAGEAEQQLARYAKWLNNQQGYSLKKLIFLTPTAHESVTGKKVDYLRLSYLDLADAFISLVDKINAESIKVVLMQYITTCKLIGGVNMSSPDEQLLELLSTPENIKTVFEIEQQVSVLRSHVAKVFCEYVKKNLQEKLKSAKLEKRWKAVYTDDSENNSIIFNVEIITLQHQHKNNYKVYAEYLFDSTKADKGWVGWYRPDGIDLKITPDTENLTNKMVNDGCSGAEVLLVGWKHLRNEKGGFIVTDSDDIIACIEDNQSENHPLANEIVEELWQMFTTYRTNIQALDSFKQAAVL